MIEKDNKTLCQDSASAKFEVPLPTRLKRIFDTQSRSVKRDRQARPGRNCQHKGQNLIQISYIILLRFKIFYFLNSYAIQSIVNEQYSLFCFDFEKHAEKVKREITPSIIYSCCTKLKPPV
jgi:hypothetical protein